MKLRDMGWTLLSERRTGACRSQTRKGQAPDGPGAPWRRPHSWHSPDWSETAHPPETTQAARLSRLGTTRATGVEPATFGSTIR
jgi:hypothetical protein